MLNNSYKLIKLINIFFLQQGAYRCYSQALLSEKDPVMKACMIREFNEINKNLEMTSEFSSRSHRIYELEKSSNEKIMSNDLSSALENLTEIVEIFNEKKCESLYSDVMSRIEITRLLLLLILELPANRQAPSHIKLMEKYSWSHENFDKKGTNKILDSNLTIMLESLVFSCRSSKEFVHQICQDLSMNQTITKEQHALLTIIDEKFQ
jgi:hypothetical protein